MAAYPDESGVKALVGGQAAGQGEQGAGGALAQGELGAGEEEAGEDHGLQEGALARGADADEEAVQAEVLPGLDQDGEAAEVQCAAQRELVMGDEVAAGEGLGDELPDGGRQGGDVADGAGAGAGGGAEGFANEEGEVNFVAATGFGGLDEH